MATEFREPQWLLPNELNQAIPADGATGSGLTEDRQSLYSMEFDGVNDAVRVFEGVVADNPFLAPNNQITISAFINIAGAFGFAGNGSIFGSSLSGSGAQLMLRINSSNQIVFRIRTSAPYLDVTGTTTLSNDTWYHVAVTWDGVNVQLYLDGSPEGSPVANSIFNPPAGTYYTNIGTAQTAATTHYDDFNGKIDEVAVWQRGLSSDEVDTLWNGGVPGNAMTLNPMAYYPLGEQARLAGTADWQFPNQSLESYAFDFDGSDYIDCGNDSSLNITDNLSVSAWIKTTDNGLQTIVNKDQATPTRIWNLAMGFGTISFQVRLGATAKTASSATNLSDGVWHHVVGTYEPSTEVKIYIDGVLADTESTSIPASLTDDATIPVYMGSYSNSTAERYAGEISNVTIWDSTLTGPNVTTLYNNGIPLTTLADFPSSGDVQGWWKLNSSATFDPTAVEWTIPDDSTNSNTGTSTGMDQTNLVTSDLQFESPYSNFSLEFDGTDDYIDCTNDSIFNLTTGMTISAWINPTVAVTNKFLVAKRWSTNSYQIATAGSINPQCSVWIGTTRYNASGSTVLSAGTWYHIVGTFDGSNVKVYVDGVLEGTTAASGSLDQTADIVSIAKGVNNNTYNFNGKIDEVAIWDSALTAAQVTQVYNNGYPRDLTFISPISWWRLGEDAYFVSPDFTIPNKITGAPNAVTANMDDVDLVANAPGSFGGGLGYSLDVEDRIGDAKESTANSVSYNMIQANRISYPAGYVPTQVDNDYAMAFDGISTYIDVGTISLGTIFTVSCWVNFNSFSATTGIIFGGGVSYYALYAPNSTTIWAYFGGGSSFTVPALSGWNNLVFTRNGGDGELFLNGVSQGTKTTYGANNFDLNFIGCENQAGGTEYYVDGEIDEAAVFDYVLSANQIQQDIYGGGRAPKCADLNNISNLTPPVAWYRMGD